MSCSLRSKLFFFWLSSKLSRRTRAETLARQTKCRVFEIAVMQSMTSMYMSRLAETSHTGRFDHARLPLWSGGLETLYTIFFPSTSLVRRMKSTRHKVCKEKETCSRLFPDRLPSLTFRFRSRSRPFG